MKTLKKFIFYISHAHKNKQHDHGWIDLIFHEHFRSYEAKLCKFTEFRGIDTFALSVYWNQNAILISCLIPLLTIASVFSVYVAS